MPTHASRDCRYLWSRRTGLFAALGVVAAAVHLGGVAHRLERLEPQLDEGHRHGDRVVLRAVAIPCGAVLLEARAHLRMDACHN